MSNVHSANVEGNVTPAPALTVAISLNPNGNDIFPQLPLFGTTNPTDTPAPVTTADANLYGTSSEDMNISEILKRCFTCKKEFGENVNIFMYKGLAFCSRGDCRIKEIKKDEREERVRKMMDNWRSNHVASKENSKIFFFGVGDA